MQSRRNDNDCENYFKWEALMNASTDGDMRTMLSY